jgi:phage terminase large subunit-like protein
VFKTELANARAVRDGSMVLPLLPILYEFPERMVEDKSWRDPAHWRMVNPNLGRSTSVDFLARELMKAEGPTGSPEQLLLIASQHFNIEIGLRLRSDAWTGAKYWIGAADPTLSDLDALLARSEVAVVGIDGGGLDDLLGLAVIGRCKTTKRWLLWNHAWAQDDVLKQRQEIAPRLGDFMAAGSLTLCEAPPEPAEADQVDGTADFKAVADIVERVKNAGLLPDRKGVGFDPAGVGAMVDELAARGIETDANGGPVVGVTQGWRLSPAIWTAERKLKDGTLKHAGQDMMAWCVGNAKAEQRGNAVAITKQAAGKAKIDPLVATFNAVMLMSLNPEAVGDGVGFFVVT